MAPCILLIVKANCPEEGCKSETSTIKFVIYFLASFNQNIFPERIFRLYLFSRQKYNDWQIDFFLVSQDDTVEFLLRGLQLKYLKQIHRDYRLIPVTAHEL